ncbi:outer membrane lipoprotein carrier protein LolA [Parasulfuritortus cantonensis]|uniref:Outer membrane lipoprotein carrier protein LolA n=2 Tax=Parasulfuritortus cantonensis TaxID=2528202 RepID=A0A4R1BFE0_9PROT|nr:outer membrane lipoprotein carrier protein LolA [Parasulfuritortus cantonensis]
MRSLAENRSGKATFVEKKYMQILDQPIIATGELSFVAPDRLEKRTVTPKPETLILDGDVLTIERPGKATRTVSLQEHPEVAGFIESIRGTLAGNLSALKTFYDVTLTGSADNWQLTLKPRQNRLRSVFDHIAISGSQAEVRSVELEQRDGDHSEMAITRSRIAR